MNTENSPTSDDTQPETRVVAELIRTAGRRAAPPQAAYRRTLELATEAWLRKSARLRRRRQLAAAACGLAAGMTGLFLLRPVVTPTVEIPPIPVAKLERAIGRLEVWPPGASAWQIVQDDGSSLLAGSRLRTGPGSRAGFRLTGGSSLRLAEASEVGLEDAARLELVAGRAYIDSGSVDAPAATPLEIVTRKATARELGTQFEVALIGDTYRLRVREGRVVLSQDGQRAEAAAGEQLIIGSDHKLVRTFVSATHADWRWVESVAAAPDINDRPVSELLNWVARETGRRIRYSDADVERRAATTILHGSIRHLAPLEALRVMLATTNLECLELPDGTLLIQAKPTD